MGFNSGFKGLSGTHFKYLGFVTLFVVQFLMGAKEGGESEPQNSDNVSYTILC